MQSIQSPDPGSASSNRALSERDFEGFAAGGVGSAVERVADDVGALAQFLTSLLTARQWLWYDLLSLAGPVAFFFSSALTGRCGSVSAWMTLRWHSHPRLPSRMEGRPSQRVLAEDGTFARFSFLVLHPSSCLWPLGDLLR